MLVLSLLYIITTKKSPKSFFNKFIKTQKKLASQLFSSEKQKETIMVTMHFFRFFRYIKWRFWKMDIYKCPKPKNVRQTQKVVFYHFLYKLLLLIKYLQSILK